MKIRCAALIRGRRCKRKPVFHHEDKFGDSGNNVGDWFVAHRYRLCRWCSRHRELLQRKLDGGCKVFGNPARPGDGREG